MSHWTADPVLVGCCYACSLGPQLRVSEHTLHLPASSHATVAEILINNSTDAVRINGCMWLCKKVKLQTYIPGVCGHLPWRPQLAQRGHRGLGHHTTPGGWGGQSCAAISTQTVAGNESLEHWECYLHTSRVEGKGEIINT